jgi:hypothetical protein
MLVFGSSVGPAWFLKFIRIRLFLGGSNFGKRHHKNHTKKDIYDLSILAALQTTTKRNGEGDATQLKKH